MSETKAKGSARISLPRHINLSIEHSPHATNYQSVAVYLDDFPADIREDERARAIAADELWVIQWYPDTPIGFLCVAAATLEKALADAIAAGASDDARRHES